MTANQFPLPRKQTIIKLQTFLSSGCLSMEMLHSLFSLSMSYCSFSISNISSPTYFILYLIWRATQSLGLTILPSPTVPLSHPLKKNDVRLAVQQGHRCFWNQPALSNNLDPISFCVQMWMSKNNHQEMLQDDLLQTIWSSATWSHNHTALKQVHADH